MISEQDKIVSFTMANKDFIDGHKATTSLYMPKLAPMMVFIQFSFLFDCSDDFSDTYYPLFYLAVI